MSGNSRFAEALLARCRNIKVLLLDVDGVLTDGGLLYSAQGETLKRFNTLDGHGLKMLQRAGISVAVITGRVTRNGSWAGSWITLVRRCPPGSPAWSGPPACSA